MRFGNWRGVALALTLTAIVSTGQGRPARAGEFFHTIPRSVEAVDLNTGGPYMAPPIPYGCYAKGHGIPGVGGLLCGLGGCGHGGCNDGGCNDGGCGHGHGLGLFHRKGCGGDPCGDPCGACSGSGCGFCHGMGLLKKCGGGGLACGKATTACSVVQPSCQTPMASSQSYPSAQCATPGCNLRMRHSHRLGRGCSDCGGAGCGFCQRPGLFSGKLCGSCGGGGCGSCGGRGLCGDGGSGCGACGGRGCGLCGKLGVMKASLLGLPGGLVAKALHKGEIEWFVGPGGPVPLTPGYVPYVVPTRSPRDFFAFPPFTDALP